jgi:hypothetical protein
LHIQRPFFNPFALLLCSLCVVGGGGGSFPSPMPVESWEVAEPARPTPSPTKPGARVQTRVQPGAGSRVRVQVRARYALDPRARVQGRVRFPLDLRARWTPESDPKQIGLCALPWLVVQIESHGLKQRERQPHGPDAPPCKHGSAADSSEYTAGLRAPLKRNR